MHLIKLSEDDLKKVSSQLTIQRAESYVGNFYDCSLNDKVLSGKIRGNHGEYSVEVSFNDAGEISAHKCMCETSKEEFCKHAAALGLTYIYTPWLFSGKRINHEDVKTFDELKYYIATTPLKEMITNLKSAGYSLADIAELLKISVLQLSTIVNSPAYGAYQACMFLSVG